MDLKSKRILDLTLSELVDYLSPVIADVVASEIRNYAIANKKLSEEETLLSRKQTAALLSISVVTLDSYCKKNLLNRLRMGSRIRFRKSEVLSKLEERGKSLQEKQPAASGA